LKRWDGKGGPLFFLLSAIMSSSGGGTREAGSSEGSPAKKKLKLVDLPADSLGSIAEQAGDFESMLNLARTDPKLAAAVQQWKCFKCDNAIFVPNDDPLCLSILPTRFLPFSVTSVERSFAGKRALRNDFVRAESAQDAESWSATVASVIIWKIVEPAADSGRVVAIVRGIVARSATFVDSAFANIMGIAAISVA
jgi:hypothetical protein